MFIVNSLRSKVKQAPDLPDRGQSTNTDANQDKFE